MKILVVLLLTSILLGQAYFSQDRIAFSDKTGDSYQAQIAHEYQTASAIRRVVEHPVTCEFNLRGLVFNPAEVAAGQSIAVPSIALTGAVIARPGLAQHGARTSRLEITNAGYADLGPGPAGLHRYRATLVLESEKLAINAPGGRQMVSEFAVNVCIRTADNEIVSCDPCPAVPPPPAADCAPGAPFRCHWHPCTLTTGSGPSLQCVAWTSDIQCVADCTDCHNYPTVPGEFVRNCRRAPLWP